MGHEAPVTASASGRPDAARPTQVMIVDDSLTARSALARIIDAEPDMTVVATASSAEVALKSLVSRPADVVLLDLEMPGMGGLDALPRILAGHRGIQVLVVSSLTEEGAEPTLAALAMGAADTMPKPRVGDFGRAYCDQLFAKIRALGGGGRKHAPLPLPLRSAPAAPRSGKHQPELLAIGASTGGIHALGLFLRNLPRSFDLPILVTQHLPGSFMAVLARQLEQAAGRTATVAADGTVIERRQIYVAPGGGHLTIERKGSSLACRIARGGSTSGCTPSVDPMLDSLARATEGRAIAVILSGMGRDGAIGAQALAAAGGTIMAQDRDSAAVWGMPRAVAESGIASIILPPAQLAREVAALAGMPAWT